VIVGEDTFLYIIMGEEARMQVQERKQMRMIVREEAHVVRNHNSVGVKRPYLHKLSFDHLHYGVA
jgi:hypothetical protein